MTNSTATLIGAFIGGTLVLHFLYSKDEKIVALNPLVAETLINDCKALKGRPVPKYPANQPTMVYRVDCMQ